MECYFWSLVVLLVVTSGSVLCSEEIKISGNETLLSSNSSSSSGGRSARQWPFWSVGRIANLPCQSSNGLTGTCQIRGECDANGGIAYGTCSTLTTQSVCCVFVGTCGGSSSQNVTYFRNSGYPAPYNGGGTCSFSVVPQDNTICQLRIDFTAFSLAQPTGDGVCSVDNMQVLYGGTRLTSMCGDNNGQHVYIPFSGTSAISVQVSTTPSTSFNRVWNLKLTQIPCTSQFKAPPGCLQYYSGITGDIYSFNYGTGANPALNAAMSLTGSRQLASMNYGICVQRAAGRCTITYKLPAADPYAFTLTSDVTMAAAGTLGTAAAGVQAAQCTTDYLIIPNPVGIANDRFCGAGLAPVTSNSIPFVLWSITDANETPDVANRGFHLLYTQNLCAVPAG
ncbi:uncharacterized protein LOC6040518 [Culex quinquefasciatus]|uniref:uncharacterized protein LOC6040518 n=1 Tax=Culex quinquefasciatus TaxID=7176 RepID=UPI0018E3B2CC|nr:uncharacterized protein LOC6040518 [Culex quinquefasciatus]